MRFAERHAWQFFLAMGLLGIAFGLSDLSIAVTFVSRQLAVAILVIGILQTVVSATALRDGQRWAWLLMWIWPAYAVADLLVLTTRPGGPEVASIVYSASVALLAVLALGLSHRRYLRGGD